MLTPWVVQAEPCWVRAVLAGAWHESLLKLQLLNQTTAASPSRMLGSLWTRLGSRASSHPGNMWVGARSFPAIGTWMSLCLLLAKGGNQG